MTDRDDYMRRQEMDHDLLRQRDPNHTQRVGRGLRTPGNFPLQTFEWALPQFPSPIEQFRELCQMHELSGIDIDKIAPAVEQMLGNVYRAGYRDGERMGMSRARSSPGNGDMGG